MSHLSSLDQLAKTERRPIAMSHNLLLVNGIALKAFISISQQYEQQKQNFFLFYII